MSYIVTDYEDLTPNPNIFIELFHALDMSVTTLERSNTGDLRFADLLD